MPYQKPDAGVDPQACDVCFSKANIKTSGGYVYVDCSRCGDFQADRELVEDFPLSQRLRTDEARSLASHIIRRMQGKRRPIITDAFMEALDQHSLPTPGEMSDNLLLAIAERVEGRPGRPISLDHGGDLALAATIGAVDSEDVHWAVRNIVEQQLIKGVWQSYFTNGWLTASGWQRVDDLKRAHVASRYAFFARQFKNSALDDLFSRCLQEAVKHTGYELRTVTQKAGHIDAIIEDEIRRCRFLIADLTDANAGAYWEAGFAEGLGKDVIYICRDGVQTHFDTDHRQTVRWDLKDLPATGARLKAVIRNTLLADAKQDDDG